MRRVASLAAPGLLVLAAGARAGLPGLTSPPSVLEGSVSGDLAPGGRVEVAVTTRAPDLDLEVRWPDGLRAAGPSLRRLEEPVREARFRGAVTGPVSPEAPVYVVAYAGGATRDSLELPVRVGIHEGGVGPPEGFCGRWLGPAIPGEAWPLPKVSEGDGERLLAGLPRDPEGRIRALLRAGVSFLAEERLRDGVRALSRAHRLVRVLRARGPERLPTLGFHVSLAHAVGRAVAGRREEALELLEDLPDPEPASLRRYAEFVRGKLLLEAGRVAEGREALERALRENPYLHAARLLLE